MTGVSQSGTRTPFERQEAERFIDVFAAQTEALRVVEEAKLPPGADICERRSE